MAITGHDISADWKQERFIVADRILHDCSGHLIVLTDTEFWCDHITDLVTWCRRHDVKVQGMTVEIPTDELLSMFVLRWA